MDLFHHSLPIYFYPFSLMEIGISPLAPLEVGGRAGVRAWPSSARARSGVSSPLVFEAGRSREAGGV